MEITHDSGVWDLFSNPITEANNYLHFCFLPIIVPFTKMSSVNITFHMKWAFLMLFTDEEAEVRRLRDISTMEPERAGWEAMVGC